MDDSNQDLLSVVPNDVICNDLLHFSKGMNNNFIIIIIIIIIITLFVYLFVYLLSIIMVITDNVPKGMTASQWRGILRKKRKEIRKKNALYVKIIILVEWVYYGISFTVWG